MTRATIILLPHAPAAGDAAAHWWAVDQQAVTGSGTGPEWIDQPREGAGGALIALAPTASVRLEFSPVEVAADRQALGIARSAALVTGAADRDTLHAVSALEVAEEDGKRIAATAVVANGIMLEWLDWLEGLGVDPIAIVPAGLILPRTPEWQSAAVGGDRLLVRRDMVLPDEAPFRAAFAGTDPIGSVDTGAVEARIAALPDALPLNLRTGRFARRRLWVLDRARMRDLAVLAALIPLLGLLMAIVTIVRLNSASRSLERETATLVSERLGREVTVEGASAALGANLAEQAGATGSPFSSLSAVYQQLQLTPAVGAQALAWRRDGTLSATLAAPRPEDLNRVLIGLQASGYRITAVPRQATDGRAMTDITVRTAP